MPAEISLAQWRQRGRACLWRYKDPGGNFQGWHFTADREGCDGMIDLISILLATRHRCHRTLDLGDPISVGADRVVGRRPQGTLAAPKLRLTFEPEGPSGECEIEEQDDRVELVLGSGQLARLRAAIERVRHGEGDFDISLGEGENRKGESFWFWWWPRGR